MLITLRAATIEDAHLISTLARETFYETYAWYNTEEDMRAYTETNFSLQQTQSDLTTEGTKFFLAFTEQTAIGYVKLRTAENPPELQAKKHIEIERIYVRQSFQKAKAGYALMKKCMEYAKEQGFDCIWLGVWEKNEKALAFYKRVGFEIFGTHIFTLGNDPQQDYLMKLELA